MKRYVLRRHASADLREISAYSAREWGRPRANAYLRNIQEAIERVALAPDIGTACDDIKPGHRKYGVGSHIVFYCRAPDRIEIVRILHQRMDAGRHLS